MDINMSSPAKLLEHSTLSVDGLPAIKFVVDGEELRVTSWRNYGWPASGEIFESIKAHFSGHELYATKYRDDGCHSYDPADDGPEVDIINRIHANFTSHFLKFEKRFVELDIMREWASQEIFQRPFNTLFTSQYNYICVRVDRALERIGLL